MTLVHDMLSAAAASWADRRAIVCGDEDLTFGALERASAAVGAALREMGVEPGDRVVVYLENRPELAVCLLGVMRAGGVAVVVSAATRGARLGFMLADCGARVLVASARSADVVAEARARAGSVKSVVWCDDAAPPPAGDESLSRIFGRGVGRAGEVRVSGEDLAAIIYTSGTTGEPKGVMHTHRGLVSATGSITGYLGNTADDVVCCVMPLAYSYGLCQLLGALRTGYTLLLERSFAFPFDVLKRMAANRATGLPALPPVFARLLQMMPLEGIDLSSLRYMTNAAAGLPVAHVRGLREAFPRVELFLMYGQTECIRATYLDPACVDARPGSSGKAIPGCEAVVVDGAGRIAPAGATGKLLVRGPNVMRGYWGRAAETAAKLTDGPNPRPGEKWLQTGDLFKADAEGFLYFVGRTDDIFKCRGEKVSPSEIEHALCELEGVAEAAVCGVDDPIDGQAVKAIVVPREGATPPLTEQRVRQHCKARLNGAMMPKYVEIRESLPRTASGKLDRSALRAERGS